MKNFNRLNLQLDDNEDDFPIAEENENEVENELDIDDIDNGNLEVQRFEQGDGDLFVEPGARTQQ